MTSNCDVTNSAHQIEMAIYDPEPKPHHENFLRTPLIITESWKENPFDLCLESLQQLFGVSSFEYALNNTLS